MTAATIQCVATFIAECEEERARDLMALNRVRTRHIRKIERVKREKDARSYEYAVRNEVLDYLSLLKELEFKKIQHLNKHIEGFEKRRDDLYLAFRRAKKYKAPLSLRDDLMENLSRLKHDISLIQAKKSLRYGLMKKYGQMKHDLVSNDLGVTVGERVRRLLPEPEDEKISGLPSTLPICYELLKGRIRAPERGIWVELPRGFTGTIVEDEDVYDTYEAQQKVETFIRSVNYRDKTAFVSLKTPRLLRRFSRNPNSWYKFEIIDDLGVGYRIRIEESISGFLPKKVGGGSLSPGNMYSGRLGRLNKFFLDPSIIEVKR